MRDAFGGTFMMYIFIIFLTVYCVFIAIAFNYARAFRVKNKVIDIIEQSEGIDFNNVGGELGEINKYLSNAKYRVHGIDENTSICEGYDYINSERGYCIAKTFTSNDGYESSYYKVVTFVKLEIPFLEWFSYTIPVKGETRKIERIS